MVMLSAVPREFFQFGLAANLLLFLLSVSWYFVRRNRFPLKQRQPYAAMLELLCTSGIGTVIVISDAFPDNPLVSACSTVMYSITGFVYLLMATMACRLFWVWHRDFVTKVGIKNQEALFGFKVYDLDEEEDMSKRLKTYLPAFVERNLVNHLSQISVPRWFTGFSVFFGFAAIGDYILLAIYSDYVDGPNIYAHSDECLPLLQASVAYKMIFFMILACYIMALSATILNMKDGLGIRREMISLVALLTGVVILLACILITSVAEVLLIQTKIWGFLIGIVFMPAVHFSQGFRIIWLSYAHERNQKNAQTTTGAPSDGITLVKRDSQQDDSLDLLLQTLEDSQGKKLLREFMQREFSLENFLFCEACLNYENTFRSEAQHVDPDSPSARIAFSILDNFVKETSPFAVNLPHPIRQELVRKLARHQNKLFEKGMTTQVRAIASPVGSPEGAASSFQEEKQASHFTADLFKPARDEILRLIARDTFLRFKSTEAFLNFKKNKDKALSRKISPRLSFMSKSQ
eukprot:TRINITY_DN18174_c0_g1_i1.p1 TRINITY_DN18174_c0_g1~~TRINITY_DN18174_c0_g1_i1.p1  ORF type:complete len:519 (-),score=98.72 TRINITY_DN18174_c0_g1_i1:36-1592(-)